MTSRPRSRPPARARTWKLVRSWPVAALIWPPRASMASTIALAERAPAPLKTMCSRRCDPAAAGRVLEPRAAAGDHREGEGVESLDRVGHDRHAVGQHVGSGVRPWFSEHPAGRRP